MVTLIYCCRYYYFFINEGVVYYDSHYDPDHPVQGLGPSYINEDGEQACAFWAHRLMYP